MAVFSRDQEEKQYGASELPDSRLYGPPTQVLSKRWGVVGPHGCPLRARGDRRTGAMSGSEVSIDGREETGAVRGIEGL